MAYEVISIGDGEMLYNAFQGVAMIFGSGNLEKIIESGFIVGTMLICIRYLTNQEFPLHHFLVGVTVYSVMFVPTDTVTIEDIYTGDVRVVANVPIGVAMPMSVISTMGVNMTEMFETAFSTPSEASMLSSGGIGTGGYLSALNTLIKLRHIGMGTTGSNAGWEGDIGKTINLYIENCVMFDLELTDDYHEVTRESLEKSPDLWDAMKTTFKNIDIVTFLPSTPTGAQKSCKDAYEALNTYLNDSATIDKTDRYVAGLLNITDSGQRADDKIDRAASALSIAGFESQKFMRNALLASYLKDGPSAFIMRTGQEQLNLQWASEQGLFNEIARPLMAFVEMFTVAISPIVAFLTTLGPIGMTMMVRYVQMMLWIALWGPIMAVCNLYITIVTTRALKVIADNASTDGSGMEAMIMHDQLYQTLETQLSTGGMLASSVPALSLMIVYGGSVAATNLAGKMTSGASSSVNPSRLMPDPVSISQPMQIGSMSEYSPNTGAGKSGMVDIGIQGGKTLSKGNISAGETAQSASNTFGQTVSSTNQAIQKSGAMQSNVKAQLSGFTSADSSGNSTTNGLIRTSGEGTSLNKAESEVMTAAAGLNVPIPGVKAALEARAGSSATRANELTDILNNTRSEIASSGHEETSSSGSSNTNSNQTFSGTEESSAQAKQFSDQATSALSAIKKYSETSAMMESAGKSMSFEGHQFGPMLNKAGMIPDINEANEALRGKIGEAAYQRLHAEAHDEIAGSKSQLLMGGDRDALAGFLKLQAGDPVAAAEIFNKAASPTSSGSGVKMSPDENKGLKKSPEDIISPDQAKAFQSFAHDGEVSMGSVPEYQGDGGESSDSAASGGESKGAGNSPGSRSNEIDFDTGSGEGGGRRGSAANPSVPHMASNSETGHKPAADHNGPKTKIESGGKHGANISPAHKDGGVKSQKSESQPGHSPKFSWAKDPKETDRGTSGSSQEKPTVGAINQNGNTSDPGSVRNRIDSSKLLHDSPIDAGGLVGSAIRNEAAGIADVAKDTVDSAITPGGFINDMAKKGNEILTGVQNEYNKTLKTSSDSAKEILGNNDRNKSTNELPHIQDDNDLPPNPKN